MALLPFDGSTDLMLLSVPSTVTGTLIVDVDGEPWPAIDLITCRDVNERVLLVIPGHADRSIGLSWTA